MRSAKNLIPTLTCEWTNKIKNFSLRTVSQMNIIENWSDYTIRWKLVGFPRNKELPASNFFSRSKAVFTVGLVLYISFNHGKLNYNWIKSCCISENPLDLGND
jgi:hypothetical protein